MQPVAVICRLVKKIELIERPFSFDVNEMQ